MHAQLTLDDITAVDQLADAVAWRAQHPAAYKQLVAWAEFDVENGSRPAIDLYFNLLRRPHFCRLLGLDPLERVYRCNNSLRSAIARLISRDHGISFELRKSRYDGHMAVNATPTVRRADR